jgi:anti-anti-sigma factor
MSMRPLARVRVERRGEVPIVAIEGEIDASNASDIAIEIRATVDNRATALVVDLSPTRYLDSAGVNLLFALGDDMRTRQLTLRVVVAPGSSIARMLAITSLDKALPTFATVDDAVA